MEAAPPPTRRAELAEFLRRRRESTAPDTVGLPTNGRLLGEVGRGLDAQLGTKEMADDEFGDLALLHLQALPTNHPDLRLLHFLPADAASRAALADAT